MVEINREISELPKFKEEEERAYENESTLKKSRANAAVQMDKNKASVRRMMDGDNLVRLENLSVQIPAIPLELSYQGSKYRLSNKQIDELKESYAREFDDAIKKVQLIPRYEEYSLEFRKEQMQNALNQAAKRARRFIDKPVDGD
jgi:hypothetical protein